MDVVEVIPEKKKKKSSFQKYGETVGQTTEELARRDRRMQRFSDINDRATPPRVDTPDYVRDAQIAASLVPPFPPFLPTTLLLHSSLLVGSRLITVLLVTR
jgi:hypothetical protein